MDRLEMGLELLKRAKHHRNSIGDHGDSYEDSLLSGVILVDLKILIKEIMEHLRSALDYSAREISELCMGHASDGLVYFPIVNQDYLEVNFRSHVGQLIPGLLQNKPDLEAVFAFQPFASAQNTWISKFATLSNENKHEQLSVAQRTKAQCSYWKDGEGKNHLSIKKLMGHHSGICL